MGLGKTSRGYTIGICTRQNVVSHEMRYRYRSQNYSYISLKYSDIVSLSWNSEISKKKKVCPLNGEEKLPRPRREPFRGGLAKNVRGLPFSPDAHSVRNGRVSRFINNANTAAAATTAAANTDIGG